MSSHDHSLAHLRTRWSAIGAAIAITLGAGGIGMAQAAVDSGDKPVTVTVDSKRILDTRTNLGLVGPFAKDAPRDVQVTGSVAVATATGTAMETVVPAGPSAVLVNVTVVTPTDIGFLTLRAGGAAGAPTTSTVNFAAPGGVEPNAATVDLSADGKVQVWVFMPSATARADVLIDVVGYTIDHNHDDRYYTEGEVDTAVADAVAPKADSADVYTRTATDTAVAAAVAPKADSADVYTMPEVDALVAPLFGLIESDGTMLFGSASIVSSERLGVGYYRVTFDRDVSECAAIASDYYFGSVSHISADSTFGANEVRVWVVDSAAAQMDTRVNLVVQCMPPGAAPVVAATATSANEVPND